MRMRWLAVVAALAAWSTSSEARAQLGYVSGPNSYTIERSLPGAVPGGGSLGNNPAGSFTVPSRLSDTTYNPTYYGYPAAGYVAPYAGAAYGPYAPWGGYVTPPSAGATLYAGYRGYRGYGFLAYGRGAHFRLLPATFLPHVPAAAVWHVRSVNISIGKYVEEPTRSHGGLASGSREREATQPIYFQGIAAPVGGQTLPTDEKAAGLTGPGRLLKLL